MTTANSNTLRPKPGAKPAGASGTKNGGPESNKAKGATEPKDSGKKDNSLRPNPGAKPGKQTGTKNGGPESNKAVAPTSPAEPVTKKKVGIKELAAADNVAVLKDVLYDMLREKQREVLDRIKQDIMESTEGVRDYFDFLGGEEFEEDDETISVIFPNRAQLQAAMRQLPPEMDYDLFYYEDLEPPVDPNIPYFPHSEDGEDHERVAIDMEDIPETDIDDAFELVIYKDANWSGTPPQAESDHDLYDDVELPDQPLTEKFSKGQMDQLQKQYAAIKTMNPSSPKVKELQAFIKGLPADAKKQIFDAKIPFLWTMARESVELTEGKQPTYTAGFEVAKIKGVVGYRAQVMNPENKTSYLGADMFKDKKDAIAYAQKYLDRLVAGYSEPSAKLPMPDKKLLSHSNKVVKGKYVYGPNEGTECGEASGAWLMVEGNTFDSRILNQMDATKHLKGSVSKDPILWFYDDKSKSNYWMNGATGEVVHAKEKSKPAGAKEYSGNPNKPIKEGYIGDETDKQIDKLFKGAYGNELSTAYNDENKEAVDAVLKKYKIPQINVNKIMKKMFGARSRVAMEGFWIEGQDLDQINENWVNIGRLQDSMLKGKHGTELKKAINNKDKKAIADIGAKYKSTLYPNELEYFADAVKGLQLFRGIPEANQNESGRAVKRRVSYAKKRRGGKLVNRRQRRRKGKVSKGAGKGYKAKGAGWKTKLIQSNRKRKISKRKNVKAQKMGKRFASRSRNIRKKLGFRSGT